MTNDELRWLAAHVSGYTHEDIGDMNSHVAASKVADEALALLDEVERLREALQEISKGEGAFNHDPLKHCANTVEDMKAIAKAAPYRVPLKLRSVSLDVFVCRTT